MTKDIEAVPFVSLIIPVRNEADFIAVCLGSVDALRWPKDRLEVLVCDGMSSDRTADVVREMAASRPHLRLLENKNKTLAAGWNLGLRESRGEIVCMMIAHQTYAPDYLEHSIRYLRERDADGVGGSMTTLPQDDSVIGRSIAAVWTHPFGVGNAYFRTGTDRPRWVDNIHCGVFRREAIERVAGYNEALTRSQDADMQTRLRRAGGRLLLVPESFTTYYTRSEFRPFAKYAYVNGYWVARPLAEGVFLSSIRHWVPFIFVLSIVVLAIAAVWWDVARWLLLADVVGYLAVVLYASIQVALRRRDARYGLTLPFIFATLHIGYGIGTAAALLQLGVAAIVSPLTKGKVDAQHS